MTPAQNFITQRGIIFKVERNGCIISEIQGLPNHEKSTSRAYIGFFPNSDILTGDWLINPANEKFYVTDTLTDFFMSEASQLKAYYQTSAEYNSVPTATTIFNIGTANSSVIGTQENVILNYNDSIQKAKEQIATSDSFDKEDLQKIVSLLEMITDNQVTPHAGLFSKFSAVMERNSWITGTIASAILNWLTTQPH